MAQTQRAQGPSEPKASGGAPDAQETWGNGGRVGDGRYRLTRRLGRGGMAEVFAAEDLRLGRTVAVKLLRADLAEDPVSKARFTREAQSVASLNHQAVVAVYDSGEDTVGQRVLPYIVMELIEGRTIRDLLLTAEAPPPDQALIIVSGVLDALAYSHHHGIVHRDIKPANVIITKNGAVKVMDFGIARALHGVQSTMTQTGMVMGTPQYLSPEQALGRAVDTRSDLYSTGCLLYELLALRPPFTGETPLSVVYQHVQDMPVPPSQLSATVPPELDGLVTRALAKDPDDRFQSAEEMQGMVQYALRMLDEKGGNTGLWNTGPVVGDIIGSAPTAPTVIGGTSPLPQPGQGDTPPIGAPVLGGVEGGDGFVDGPADQRSGDKDRRSRVLLLVALAVITITAGIVFALNWDNQPANQQTKPPPTPSGSSKKKPTASPEPTAEATQPDPSTGGQYDYTPLPTPSQWNPPTPSEGPSDWPSHDSSAPATTGGDSTGTESDGGSTSDGGTDSGTDSGTDTGADSGTDGADSGTGESTDGSSGGSTAGSGSGGGEKGTTGSAGTAPEGG